MKPWLSDWAITAYCAIVSALLILRAAAVPLWWVFVLGHVAIAGVVWALVRLDRPGFVGLLRSWDALVLVPVLFIQAMLVVHRVHPTDYDDVLIRIDTAIGGMALLRAMVGMETGFLVDVAKLSWMSYYPLPLLAAVPLYLRGREAFVPLKNALVLGWIVSYLAYFAWPAVGPGNHAKELDLPQPRWEAGILASPAKGLIHAMEAPEPRHTFPSGHTIIAVITAWFLVRHRAKPWLWVGVPLAAGVVVSTIYLRYHYVIDVIVGIGVAAACIAIAGGMKRERRVA